SSPLPPSPRSSPFTRYLSPSVARSSLYFSPPPFFFLCSYSVIRCSLIVCATEEGYTLFRSPGFNEILGERRLVPSLTHAPSQLPTSAHFISHAFSKLLCVSSTRNSYTTLTLLAFVWRFSESRTA